MKTKIIILIVALVSAINVFSQKETSKPLYTFCGKSGNCEMTWDEFKKCSKELTPIDKNLKIVSFNISIYTDSVYVDFGNTGNIFSKQTSDGIEKIISKKKVIAGNKIIIEEVKASQAGKEMKIPGMIIKLK